MKSASTFVCLSLLFLAVPANAAITDSDDKDFQEIRELYSKGEYEGTRRKIEEFERRYPNSAWIGQTENLLGLYYLAARKPAEAIIHFTRAIETGSPGNRNFPHFVRYNLAKAQLEAGQLAEAERTLGAIDLQALDKDNQFKLHLLKAGIFARRGLAYEGAREVLNASRLVDPTKLQEQRSVMANPLESLLKDIQGTTPLENLYKDFEDSPLLDHVLLRLASQELNAGEASKAEIHLQTLMVRFPQSELLAQAQSLSRAKENSAPADPAAVGVLLPLKGKFAKFGNRNLQAIEMAFRMFDEGGPESKITLAIEDSGDDAEQTIKALERLVKEHHVIAVIGPLLTKGIDAVTKRAQELGVPLLSLARQAGTPGEYVLPAGMTLQMQASEIARYAIQKLKLKRFAILAPRDKVGEEFTHDFWDAVESYGGQITGAETYNPGETDFRQPVDKLSGLYYTEARHREIEELARLREANQIKKRTRKTEQFYSLKPIADYDAVFVPDEPKVAGQVLPTFLYRDVEGVRFLGPSAWNSPELIARAQHHAEGAIFPDAFYLHEKTSPAAPARKFFDQYKANFGAEPNAMDAIAYDAALVLSRALAESRSDRRSDLLAQLKKVKGFPGASGIISYKDGELYHELKILTVTKGQVAEAR